MGGLLGMDAASLKLLMSVADSLSGQELFPHKAYLYESRLTRFVHIEDFADTADLVRAVTSGDSDNLEVAVVSALLDTQTWFFRERSDLARIVDLLSERAASSTPSNPLQVWCAGVSTGQEAYSLAILVSEICPQNDRDIDIVATDLNACAIANARQGIYGHFAIQMGLSIHRMLHHFTRVGESHWQISGEMRKRVYFKEHNLLSIPPGEDRFDVILCRHVLSAMTPRARQVVVGNIIDRLNPGGVLLLGRGEHVELPSAMFSLASPIAPCAWRRH